MKKITLLLLGLLVLSLCGNVYLYVNSVQKDTIIFQQKKDRITEAKALKQSKERIQSLQIQQQAQLKNAIDQLRTQQSSPAASTTDTPLLFLSATTSDISPNKKVVTFWIKGSKTIPFDAMDLVLSYTNTKNTPLCTTGKTFALYPLIKIDSSSLNITGVAQISGNSIVTGNNSESFVTCTFEKNDSTLQTTIQLDKEKTHIYSLGASVLDAKASVIDISW